YHGESFASVEDFCQVVDDYIYWYNNGRLQKRLEGLAPMWYRSRPWVCQINGVNPQQI
ncbi:IS3 family transposase, partial [Rothia nasimurium]|uniref:IS3 family transposase n=1 Tax=Rothia nasimurium TaxID=85336 RepID=UPI001F20D9A1